MKKEEYIKLTKHLDSEKEFVEVEVSASTQSLITMLYSAMSSNQMLANAIIIATASYTEKIIQDDIKARLN
jgi:hypothetical protein